MILAFGRAIVLVFTVSSKYCYDFIKECSKMKIYVTNLRLRKLLPLRLNEYKWFPKSCYSYELSEEIIKFLESWRDNSKL